MMRSYNGHLSVLARDKCVFYILQISLTASNGWVQPLAQAVFTFYEWKDSLPPHTTSIF